jgi:hypothetical protein
MIIVIKSADRHHADHGWLSTYWHFSFSDYQDPDNMNWGALRVFNDDIIKGGGGFGAHPHRDMEIVTYVLEGQLEHQDNLGNKGVIHPGEIQVMSAGKGIVHAEYNHSKTDPVHLMQLWIIPRTDGLKPRWEQKQFTTEQRRNKLLPVVSTGDIPGTLAIDQNATIYISSLAAGATVSQKFAPARLAYLFVISGGPIELNNTKLSTGDQARVEDELNLSIRAADNAEIILLDLPPL